MQILISAILTAFIFVALTAFTFFSRVDFSFLGAFLFAGVIILMIWGAIFACILSFTGTSPGVMMAFSLFGALLFCGFIVYDTSEIIRNYGVDDYIVGAIQLYLDVIELFMYILMCASMTGNNS